MKTIGLGILAVAFLAGSADAAVVVSAGPANTVGGSTGSNTATFDSSNFGSYTYETYLVNGNGTQTLTYSGTPSGSTGGTGALVASGSLANQYSQPTNDSTNYLAVLGGYAEVLTLNSAATANNTLNFYWGTPGATDVVSFFNNGTQVGSYTGLQFQNAGYNTTNAYAVSLTSDVAFNKVVFYAGQNSFELDNVQFGTPQAASVPEPATWAMMIGGFGLVGMSLRRHRKAGVTFA
jgi:hypothetical protein